MFYVNVGMLLAPDLRYCLGGRDPLRDAMPHHGVWDHRLVDITDASSHTFWLRGRGSAYAHAERGDVLAVAAEIAGWNVDGPDSLALANLRRAERQG